MLPYDYITEINLLLHNRDTYIASDHELLDSQSPGMALAHYFYRFSTIWHSAQNNGPKNRGKTEHFPNFFIRDRWTDANNSSKQ